MKNVEEHSLREICEEKDLKGESFSCKGLKMSCIGLPCFTVIELFYNLLGNLLLIVHVT